MTDLTGESFDILFVCSANICRSPMAERLARARLPAGFGISVSSAGIDALVGKPIDPAAGAVLAQLGVDSAGHVARQLSRSRLERADLVLAASAGQREAVVRAVPLSWRRAFTMREFVRLGTGLPPPRPGPVGNKLARRVADVTAQRGWIDPPIAGEDDIADPYGGRAAVMERSGQHISRTIDEILEVLGLLVLV